MGGIDLDFRGDVRAIRSNQLHTADGARSTLHLLGCKEPRRMPIHTHTNRSSRVARMQLHVLGLASMRAHSSPAAARGRRRPTPRARWRPRAKLQVRSRAATRSRTSPRWVRNANVKIQTKPRPKVDSRYLGMRRRRHGAARAGGVTARTKLEEAHTATSHLHR